jgi:hypothetical protein
MNHRLLSPELHTLVWIQLRQESPKTTDVLQAFRGTTLMAIVFQLATHHFCFRAYILGSENAGEVLPISKHAAIY